MLSTQSARALGASRARVIVRHVIPATFGYTIVAATLSIPGFILGESALSLLGLGIQEPNASWGNLLASAQNVQSIAQFPWILTPGLFIFVTIIRRAIESLIQSQGIDDLFRIYLHAETDGIDFNAAFIGKDFDHKHEEEFDRDYMRALYDYGYQAGRQGYPWQKTPPNYSK